VTQVFYDVLANSDSTSTQVAAAYLGLAAHKEPVLLAVQYCWHTRTAWAQDKLYLTGALAFWAIMTARFPITGSILLRILQRERACTRETAKVDLGGDDMETVLSQTAAASIPASILGTADAEPMIAPAGESLQAGHLPA
jgi:hypothetical protein